LKIIVGLLNLFR